MSAKGQKYPSQVPKARGVMSSHVMFFLTHSPKTQRYSVYADIKYRKATNRNILEGEIRECLASLLKK